MKFLRVESLFICHSITDKLCSFLGILCCFFKNVSYYYSSVISKRATHVLSHYKYITDTELAYGTLPVIFLITDSTSCLTLNNLLVMCNINICLYCFWKISSKYIPRFCSKPYRRPVPQPEIHFCRISLSSEFLFHCFYYFMYLDYLDCRVFIQ